MKKAAPFPIALPCILFDQELKEHYIDDLYFLESWTWVNKKNCLIQIQWNDPVPSQLYYTTKAAAVKNFVLNTKARIQYWEDNLQAEKDLLAKLEKETP